MALTLLALTAALVGMVSSSAAGPFREDDTHAVTGTDDPDAGYRSFGKFVWIFSIVATVVFVLLLIGMFMSIGGVWENESIDPPV